jgi:hypothetical protein
MPFYTRRTHLSIDNTSVSFLILLLRSFIFVNTSMESHNRPTIGGCAFHTIRCVCHDTTTPDQDATPFVFWTFFCFLTIRIAGVRLESARVRTRILSISRPVESVFGNLQFKRYVLPNENRKSQCVTALPT